MTNPLQKLADLLATSGRQEDAEKIVSMLGYGKPKTFGHPTTPLARLESPEENLLRSLINSPEKVKSILQTTRPNDLTSSFGKRVVDEIRRAAVKDAKLHAELEKLGVISREGELLGNPKAFTREESLKIARRTNAILSKGFIFDSPETLARSIVNSAIDDMEDPAVSKALRGLFDDTRGIADAEELAETCLKKSKLKWNQANGFRAAVQKSGCKSMATALTDALIALRKAKAITASELELPQRVAQVLETQLARGEKASIRNFRDELRGFMPELVDAVTGQVDVDMFIEQVLKTFMMDGTSHAVFMSAFDAEGRRRIFENMGSFRKNYSIERSKAAGRNLLAWLYESSKFNKTVMEVQTKLFGDKLQAALWNAKVDIKVSRPTVHFDVHVPETAGSRRELQATDHLGEITLTMPRKRPIRVVAAAGEHKGIDGIGEGEKQLFMMPGRYAGKTIRTELGPARIGEDLHLDLEVALRQLEVPEAAIKRVVVEMTDGKSNVAYRRIIIYPPSTRAGVGRLDTVNGIQRLAHDVPRDEMMSLYGSLTPFFNLMPRVPSKVQKLKP